MALIEEVQVNVAGLAVSLVQRLDVELGLSRPFAAVARVVSKKYASPATLVGAEASILVASGTEGEQWFAGVVTEVSLVVLPQQDDQSVIAPTYELRIESRLALLAGSVDSRPYFKKGGTRTTEEIARSVFEDHGIASDSVSFPAGTRSHVYRVQYGESALAFVSRLFEEEGLFYAEFWSRNDDELAYALEVSSSSAKATSGPAETLPLREDTTLVASTPAVYGIDDSLRLATGRASLAGYRFRSGRRFQPSREASEVLSPIEKSLERFEVDDLLFDEKVAEESLGIRLEEERATGHRSRLRCTTILATPGRKLSVSVSALDAPREFFVVRSRIHYDRDVLERSTRSSLEGFFVDVEAIPAATVYRAPRVTPRPRIAGPQTAIIVAPPDTPEEGVCTEDLGRAKVRFHWDRYSTKDDTASCFFRVQQLQTSGSVALPRVHWEVLVDFLNGDPERPIIAGRLYNGRIMPPYALPAGKTRTSLQSASSPNGGGRNEIRLEDAAGAEEIMVNSQYNTVIAVANNRKKNVTKNETLIVGNNASLSVGGDQTVAVTRGSETNVGGNCTLSVSGNRNAEVNAVYGLTVQGNSATTIGGNLMAMIGNPLDALIALGTAKAAEIASQQADKAFAAISGAAQSAVEQVMAPVNGLMDQVSSLEGGLAAMADGKLSATAGVLGGAVAIPGASDVLRSAAQGPAAARAAEGTSTSSGQVALGSLVSAAVSGKIAAAHQATRKAIGDAEANVGQAAGGTSEANVAGPVGDLSGFSEEDATTGPGYTQWTVGGTQKESISALRLQATVEAVNVHVKSSLSEKVGAAHVEVIAGARAESVEGASSETAPAFVLVTKGDEIETVHGARQLNVGGAVMETVGGDYSIDAGAALTMVGALQDMKAKSKITFKCGASSVVIDGGGITIQSILVNVLGSGVKATKAVSDG